jgi:hypothetical protein
VPELHGLNARDLLFVLILFYRQAIFSTKRESVLQGQARAFFPSTENHASGCGQKQS